MEELINNYHQTFPNYSKLIINRGVIEGIWVMGNNYTTKTKLYGAYPHGYLERIYALFPPIEDKTLHLFSGSIDDKYDRVDFNVGIDAEEMAKYYLTIIMKESMLIHHIQLKIAIIMVAVW